MNSFYFDKMHMIYNQNKSCVKSCKNIIFFKQQHCFPKKPIVLKKKPIVFQHVHFFIPLFWNEKIITDVSNNSWTLITTSCSGNLIWAILNIVQYSIMYFVSEPYQSSSVCPNVVCQAKAGQPTCGPWPQRVSSLTSSLPRRTLG